MNGTGIIIAQRRWRIAQPIWTASWTVGLPCLFSVLLAALSGLSWRHAASFDLGYAAAAPLIAMALGRASRIEREIERLVGRTSLLALTPSARPIPGTAIDWLDAEVSRLEGLFGSVEHRLAQRHSVTGLPAREPLFARIERDIATGLEKGLLGVVAFVDFDRLTAFDPYLADHALATLARRATRMLGRRPMLAQIDRSRFAIWYDSDEAAEGGQSQIDTIGYALGDIIREGDRELLPEIRVAAAVYPDAGATPERLLARALAGLSHGSGSDMQAQADPVEMARERYVFEQDLRRAVARAELKLHYQPLVDAEAGRVCGAEALLRWQHPLRGMIAPTHFIPIMEAAGLADEIGLWALNTACREARSWQRQSLPGLRIAVNVSGHQLARDEMPAIIARTLARHSLLPDTLEIELTETVAANDVVKAGALFDELRALGVAVAIDDFGTGYSSFSALRTLRFDKIKIDREFVSAIDDRPDSQAICRSIIALGEGLGIRVLAEGVERVEEYMWLRAAGCRYFQGYYFSPPLAADGFATFVRDEARLATLLTPSSVPSQIERRVA